MPGQKKKNQIESAFEQNLADKNSKAAIIIMFKDKKEKKKEKTCLKN